MQITVETRTGKTLEFSFSTLPTPDQIKQEILKTERIPFLMQQLFHNHQPLVPGFIPLTLQQNNLRLVIDFDQPLESRRNSL